MGVSGLVKLIRVAVESLTASPRVRTPSERAGSAS